MKESQVSIGKEAAIALAESEFYKDWPVEDIAKFQLKVKELCVPFDLFHEGVEKLLGRPVQTLEFAMNFEGILEEAFEDGEPITLEALLERLPADKQVILVQTE